MANSHTLQWTKCVGNPLNPRIPLLGRPYPADWRFHLLGVPFYSSCSVRTKSEGREVIQPSELAGGPIHCVAADASSLRSLAKWKVVIGIPMNRDSHIGASVYLPPTENASSTFPGIPPQRAYPEFTKSIPPPMAGPP